MAKDETAFRTISEVAVETGVPQHILRYWETRFLELRPLQRAGKRRYYRPADVSLVRRIDNLLNRDGYTIKGVQKLLAEGVAPTAAEEIAAVVAEAAQQPASTIVPPPATDELLAQLREIRDSLKTALDADAA